MDRVGVFGPHQKKTNKSLIVRPLDTVVGATYLSEKEKMKNTFLVAEREKSKFTYSILRPQGKLKVNAHRI